MPVGTTAALLMAGGVFSATSSVMAGQQQSKAIKQKAEYDAQIYEQNATMIQTKKNIQDQQFIRNAATARGKIVAATAGKGFDMGGSPMAILVDNESQMQFDNAVNDYNLDVEKNFAQSGATNTRQQGASNSRAAAYSGYSNAFSTILRTGFDEAYLAGKL